MSETENKDIGHFESVDAMYKRFGVLTVRYVLNGYGRDQAMQAALVLMAYEWHDTEELSKKEINETGERIRKTLVEYGKKLDDVFKAGKNAD